MDINEIDKLKDKCIQEEPAYCSAACPVHVDVRLLMQNIQQSDYDKAYRIYARKVLFPGIISRVCDEPCKGSCIRNKLDDPLSIRLLERAVEKAWISANGVLLLNFGIRASADSKGL